MWAKSHPGRAPRIWLQCKALPLTTADDNLGPWYFYSSHKRPLWISTNDVSPARGRQLVNATHSMLLETSRQTRGNKHSYIREIHRRRILWFRCWRTMLFCIHHDRVTTYLIPAWNESYAVAYRTICESYLAWIGKRRRTHFSFATPKALSAP